MVNKEVVVQIFTGGFNENNISYEEIENKLEALIDKINITKVIMGWSLNKDIYLKTKEFFHSKNIELFLWIPVFSEIGILKDTIPVVDWRGEKIKSYALKQGENFEFYCPANNKNIESFKEVFEDNFEEVGFDGVFLDKIRYPSFSNGIEGVFSCFCDNCLNEYKKMGIDLKKLKEEMNKFINYEKFYDNIPFGITKYDEIEYSFKNEIWKDFFYVKSEIVFKSLKNLYEYFKNKNMKIGIDTYAPFLSYFVGQDMTKLQYIADFIKPMMYRVTKAPAGLPYEFNKLISESIYKDNIDDSEKMLLDILNIHEYDRNKFNLNFVKKELEDMKHKLNIDIYPGIEINRIIPIAKVYPDYICENIEMLKYENIKGFVLSWDLLSAHKDNIEEIIRLLGK
ncbi:hypothetical protein [Clostridium lundense]|uniref:hypothetical protein n=1 Tax=Clostridium lundense TaxID=319475 RepID=UPI0004827332|nr:hypothetical protein [Clostridium lundense]